MNLLATWFRRVLFYGICAACGFGLHLTAQWLDLEGTNQEKLFGRIAYLLGAIQTFTLILARSWAELTVDEGVRAHARERILNEAKDRKLKVFLRLGFGIGFAVLLGVSAAMLLDAQQQISVVWSSVGFSCIIAVIFCLAFSITDYFQLTEVTTKLAKLTEDSRRRKKQLESLATEKSDKSNS